jgi:hypothetical protein
VGKGTGRSGSSVDALVGITDDEVALAVPVIGVPFDGKCVPTPDGYDTSGEDELEGCELDDTAGLDGMRKVCAGAEIMISEVDEGPSVATWSDGIMLEVRGAEGIRPGGNDFRAADGTRLVSPTLEARESGRVA